jgi:hypothetical protein
VTMPVLAHNLPTCSCSRRVQICSDRQCVLCSATWPPSVHSLASDLLHDPVKIVIAGAGLKASHNITQSFMVLTDEEKKYSTLEALLESRFDASRMLVFCATKKGCDSLTRKLRLGGWPAMAIHGDKSQTERDWVLRVGFLWLHCLSSTLSICARQQLLCGLGCLVGIQCMYCDYYICYKYLNKKLAVPSLLRLATRDEDPAHLGCPGCMHPKALYDARRDEQHQHRHTPTEGCASHARGRAVKGTLCQSPSSILYNDVMVAARRLC